MKIVFLSNYFNHHQKPLSDALFSLCDEYYFVATGKMSYERKKLGYENLTAPYVLDYSEEESPDEQILKIVDDADVVISGSCLEYFLKSRKKKKKLIFRYSERPVKGNKEFIKYFPRLVLWNYKNPKNSPIFLLSASAYASYEYSKFFLFKNKAFKWGYFTEVKKYPEGIDFLQRKKASNSILWVARLIELKHPEAAIYVAEKLKKDGYSFTLKIIGDGYLKNDLKKMIEEKNLNKNVILLGAMNPNQVREEMERSEIFLFTSDKQEGWGAVLNESLNSGCAVVADHEIGAVPFLIKNGENGLIYRDGNLDDLYKKTKKLIDDKEFRQTLSKNAYDTMVYEWSPYVAAKRLIEFSECIILNKDYSEHFKSGPCSRAEIIKDNWFKNET